MSSVSLSQREIRRIEYDTREFFHVNRRPEQTASFARQITELANTRRVTPLLPMPAIDAMLRVLRRTDRPVTAQSIEKCFDILRATVFEPRMAELSPHHRPQRFNVRICPVAPGAEDTQRRAIIGSASDPSTKPGCDKGAGVDYYAKTDTHVVYVASTLLDHQSLFSLRLERDGPVPVVSLTLMAIIHEFGHAYSTFFPKDFEALRELYNAAVAVARPIAQRAGSNANGAKLLMDENDCMEFLAQAFAYENSRIDAQERRSEQMHFRRIGLSGVNVLAAAMSASLPLLSEHAMHTDSSSSSTSIVSSGDGHSYTGSANSDSGQ